MQRLRNLRLTRISLLLAGMAMATPLTAATADELPGAVTLRVENDAVKGTDANYTNGISLQYTRNDSGLLGGIWPNSANEKRRRYSSYELAQLQFTPTDTNRNPPDPYDRPYAGVLYLGITSGVQTDNSLQAFKLMVGMVGPSSLAEAGQKTSHRLLGDPLPQGWYYQLKNEPVLNLLYEYRRRFRLAGADDRLGVELVPVGTVMLGNYLTKIRAEAQLRLGYQLSADFGVTSLRGLGAVPIPESRLPSAMRNIYLFVGGGGDLVARDITLDGNSFTNGPAVGKKTVVTSGIVGLTFQFGKIFGTFSYILCGKEFSGQQEGEKYGMFALSYLLK